jgi:hypothetical protein
MSMTMPTPQGQQTQSHKGPPMPNNISVAELICGMQGWFKTLERAAAAHTHLSASLISYEGHTPEGGRKKGLPILSFSASVDGVTAVECAIDLKDIDPQYVSHVLIPLINSQRIKMIDAIEEINAHMQLVLPLLRSTNA